MTVALYSRNENGTIEYHGHKDIQSIEHGLQVWPFLKEHTPIKEKMLGWPDEEVTWYANTGFGE